MKIAYISPIYYSDVDISYLNELKQLADVYYFIPIGPLKKAAAINIDNIYPRAGVLPASVYPELKKFENLINLDKTFIINRTASHISYPLNIKIYWELYRFLKREEFDIVHITNSLLYTEFPLYLFRKKMVLSVHDPVTHLDERSSLRIRLQHIISYRLINHFILFNESQKNTFIETNGLKEKNVYLSKLSAYSYLKAYDISAPSIKGDYVLFFGWIREGKGLEVLLPAMKHVHNVLPDLKLIIAGKGDYYFDKSEYEGLDYIMFINRFVPDYELANLIANSKYVVVPYTEATQSGVIMSAYAFDKPVLATNVGGLPEMVGKDAFGKVIPANNIEALAEGMIKMAGDELFLSKKKKNIADAYTKGENSWSNIAKAVFENCYKKII